VKILEAPENPLYFTPFTGINDIDLFSVRKDAKSPADLNSTTTVSIKSVKSLIEAYNDANGTDFELLPDSIYTVDIPNSGNEYDMSFAANEFAKPFTIHLNGDKWDLAHKYAFAAVISHVDGNAKISTGKDTVITFLSVKNKYDANYRITATVSGGASNTATYTEHLATVNTNTVSKDNIGEYFAGYTTYTFNDDGSITVGAYSAPGGGSYGAEVVSSEYDEATGNFHVVFTILGGGYTFDEEAIRQ
jgi:hypothetical protein